MTNLPDKALAETILLTFDFTDAVAEMGLSDTTLTGQPTMTTATVLGTDTELVTTQPSVQGLQVKTLVSGGVVGSAYSITCLAKFSDGESRSLKGMLHVV